MPMTGKQRLERLRDILVADDFAKHGILFDMSAWCRTPHDVSPRVAGGTPECGTAACAFGHAMLDKVLQKEGLKAVYDDWSRNHLTPSYKGLRGFKAASSFFGISLREAEELFALSFDSVDNNREAVVARINRRIGRML